MVVATCNVRTLAVKGKNGYGHDERVLAKGRQLGCDFIGLQETRRADSTTFNAAGYQVFYSGQEKTAARQGLYGVRLAVKGSICRKSVCTLTNLLMSGSCPCASSSLVNARQLISSLRTPQQIVPSTLS